MGKPISDNAVEQITKTDCNACHARRKYAILNHSLCNKANSAPRDGGLVPPFHV